MINGLIRFPRMSLNGDTEFDKKIDEMLPATIEECKKKQGLLLESRDKVYASDVRSWGFEIPTSIPDCATAKIKRIRILEVKEETETVIVQYWFGKFEWLSGGFDAT